MFKWSTILNSIASGKKSPEDYPSYAPCADHLIFPILKLWEEGRVHAEWPVLQRFLNSRGHVFGGYFGVLADMTFCYTVMTILKGDEGFNTSDMRVSYFRPVSSGTLRIDGHVVNRTRRIVHVEAVFTDEKGDLVAKAVGVMAVIPMNSIYAKKSSSS
jgi:uncharacterized protein (TIGR00369 family)